MRLLMLRLLPRRSAAQRHLPSRPRRSSSISRSTGRPCGTNSFGRGRRQVLSVRGQPLTFCHHAPARRTVVPVCEVVQVDSVDVGDEGALRRVPVSLQVSLEAISVEIGAAVIARPTG